MSNFQELGLDNEIVKAVLDLGFENPTPIQEKAIPVLLTGANDFVGLAQTGTGKTAAFGLPIINIVDFSSRDTQALIICPTRELCLQITRDITNFCKYKSGANTVAIYGGASMENQVRDINRGAQIIVATPGRMVDMINRGKVRLKNISVVVLDEADEMLNMGFKEDLDTILSQTPETKKTWLFSATMQNEVARIARTYMTDPTEVTVGKQNQGAENIEHQYFVVHARDKYLALKRVVDFNPDIFGIVFCRTRSETQDVADKLIKDGYNADCLHGDLSQAQRDMVMKRYRSRSLQLLVATDVAARGIDVNDVTHVINYQLPDDVENYTHRSGRTARAGKSGVSIAIINMKEAYRIREIERQINKKFEQVKVPNAMEVCEKQLIHLVQNIKEIEVKESAIESYLPAAYEMLADLSKEEIIKRMVSVEFNRFLEYYKNAPDLNSDSKTSRDERIKRTDNATPTGRFFLNLGEMDGLSKFDLMDFIRDVTKFNKSQIGKVDLKHTFSFFEVDAQDAPMVLEAFKDQKYNGRAVRVEVSEGSGGSGRSEGRGGRSEGRGEGRGGERRSEGRRDFGRREGGSNRDANGNRKRAEGSGFGGERRSSSEGSGFGGERRSESRGGSSEGRGERRSEPRSFDRPAGTNSSAPSGEKRKRKSW
ncbi:MAG: DEAD/DEAH box helicase [Bacteroidota bacterium]